MVGEGQCSEKVWSDNSWYRYGCKRKATVVRGGKPYCTQHDPEKVKARQEASSERYRQGIAEKIARDEQAAVALLRAKGYAVIPPEAL